MAYVKAIVSDRARKHLATPQDRREFVETYLGVRRSKSFRVEGVGSKELKSTDRKSK